MKSSAPLPRIAASLLFLAMLVSLTACSSSNAFTSAPHPAASATVQGSVYGGQQPVAAATIQLYTVGTGGDGSAATPLLTATTQTDAGGNFSITGKYTCAVATSVYITATGGQPSPGTTNPALALMTALGPCTDLLPTTFTTINEVSTVAAVAALAPFMTSASALGSATSDVSSLQAAFTTAHQYADPSAGVSPGPGVPAGYAVPTALINTLADAVASCINSSGGTAGDGSPCGTLFTAATRAGAPAPTTTIAALLNIIGNSTANDASIFSLVNAQAPFQPTLTAAPADFRPRLAPTTAGNTLQISPTTLPFPDTSTGVLAVPQTISLTNGTAAAVTLGTPTLLGVNPADFTLTSACPATLAASATCTFTVSAKPTATGARTAWLQIPSNSPDTPQYIALTANGLTPTLGTVQVFGNHLTRDGVLYTPHGLNFTAFVQSPPAQPGGCDGSSSNNFQNAYNRYYSLGASDFTKLAAWGADSVRFQVSQPGLDAQNTTYYSPAFFNAFVTAVQQARAAGLVAIISIQDECQSGDASTALYPGAVNQRVWSELAPIFASDLGVMFEIYNEPEPLPNAADWQTWQMRFNSVIATIRATGATNVVVADGLNYAQSFAGVLPLTDSVNQVSYAIHPYFHRAGFTNADFATNFGNLAATAPVIATEWAAVANAATSGSTYYCDANTPAQTLLLFNYLQSHGVGMEGYTWDFTGQVFGSIVYYVNATSANYNTSTFPGLNCGDNGYGAGLTMQTWFRNNAVPATPQ